MNSRVIVIAAPLLALVAAIAIRQTLIKRRSVASQPVSDAAPNVRDPVASADAGATSLSPQDRTSATGQAIVPPTEPLAPSATPIAAPPVSARLHSLGKAIETSYASTVAAFALFGEEADYVTHDTAAERDADRLEELFSSVRAELPAELAKDCEAIVERVTAAQLQLMAFAINRKNRGLPDSAQAETELADRKAFQEEAAPMFERIKAPLGVESLGVSP